LFGALYQGGAELAFEINGFSRDMVFMMQGLIVLFAGAMAHVAAPWLARGLALLGVGKTKEAKVAVPATHGTEVGAGAAAATAEKAAQAASHG
jgi:hypothetical protein